MSELARWDARFCSPDYYFGKAPNAFLKSQTHRLEPGWKALAFADGEGRNGVFLAELGLDVLSIDFAPNAIAKAKALAKERGVDLRVELADIFTWAWPTAAFDVIVGIFFQFASPDQRTAVFENIRKALLPGGLLLIQGYRPEQVDYGTGGPPHRENMYTRKILEDAFGGFASLEINEHDSYVDEGAGHRGMSALIDLLARK